MNAKIKCLPTKRCSYVSWKAYATSAQWCGPCKAIAPYYESLATTYPDVLFYKVDVDDAPEIAKDQKVRAMPTFGFYRKGEQLGVVIGANKSALDDQLRALA